MLLIDPGAPRLVDRLAPGLMAGLLARATRAVFADGQLIHARGDPDGRLCLVLEGAVRLGRLRRDGGLALLATVAEGHHFGHFPIPGIDARSHDAVAEGRTVLAYLARARLVDLMRETPELGVALLEIATHRLAVTTEFYDDVRRLTPAERLAKLLLRAAPGGGEVACTQAQLAQTLGVSEVTLGKALRLLSQAGIAEPGYGLVRVPDSARLAAWMATRDPE